MSSNIFNIGQKMDQYAYILGIPKAPESKVAKLRGLLLLALKKVDPSIKAEQLDLKLNEDNSSSGFALLKFDNATSAKQFISQADFLVFDAKTRLRIISKATFEDFLNKKNPPTPLNVPVSNTDGQHINYYLTEPRLFDQIAYLHASMPQVAWFNHSTASIEDIELPNYCKMCDEFQFSPDGSFYVIREKSQLKFYVGENWIHFTTIEFPGLISYEFSPCGRYLLTKGNVNTDNPYNPCGCALWDVLTGNRIRKIQLNREEHGAIQFGYKSCLLHLRKGKLSVRSAPDFKEAKEICTDITSFFPSPKYPFVLTYREQFEGVAPKITVFNVENQLQIHSSSSYNSDSLRVLWHPNLPYCAVSVVLTQGSKRSGTLYVYDLVNPSRPGMLNEKFKGIVSCLDWDPTNNCFAVVVSTEKSKQLIHYKVQANLTKLVSYQCDGVTSIKFSPYGRFAILTDKNNNSISTSVQFWDIQRGKVKTIDIEAFDKAEWDPSGSFALITYGRSSQNSFFSIYLLDGNLVLKKRAGSTRVMWRPRGNLELTKEDYESIADKLEEAIQQFGKFGVVDEESREEEARQQKRDKIEKWRDILWGNQGIYHPPVKNAEIRIPIVNRDQEQDQE